SQRSAPPATSPSFPTRRSSDLHHPQIARLGSGPYRLLIPSLALDRRSGTPCEKTQRARQQVLAGREQQVIIGGRERRNPPMITRSEEHTSELQSRFDLVCRLLL